MLTFVSYCFSTSLTGTEYKILSHTVELASQNKQVEPLGDTWSYHSLSKN